MVAKRKIAFQPEKGFPLEPSNPPKTVRRNTRERNRVRQIDTGFEKLRVTIPTAAAQKKISRVKILASAVDYIQHLHSLLHQIPFVLLHTLQPHRLVRASHRCRAQFGRLFGHDPGLVVCRAALSFGGFGLDARGLRVTLAFHTLCCRANVLVLL
jgi:hypothetical protein